MKPLRTETDSMGELQVPSDALCGAQTARVPEKPPISGLRFPREFTRALGLIKKHAAGANAALGLEKAKPEEGARPKLTESGLRGAGA